MTLAFSDEEVAALRERCTHTTGKFYTHIDFDRGIALLDRLDAAEDCVRECDDSHYSPRVELVNAWRKASGHENDADMDAWRKVSGK